MRDRFLLAVLSTVAAGTASAETGTAGGLADHTGVDGVKRACFATVSSIKSVGYGCELKRSSDFQEGEVVVGFAFIREGDKFRSESHSRGLPDDPPSTKMKHAFDGATFERLDGNGLLTVNRLMFVGQPMYGVSPVELSLMHWLVDVVPDITTRSWSNVVEEPVWDQRFHNAELISQDGLLTVVRFPGAKAFLGEYVYEVTFDAEHGSMPIRQARLGIDDRLLSLAEATYTSVETADGQRLPFPCEVTFRQERDPPRHRQIEQHYRVDLDSISINHPFPAETFQIARDESVKEVYDVDEVAAKSRLPMRTQP